MKEPQPHTTLHMVSSLDGFIAKTDGSIDWMQSKDHYEKGISLSEEDVALFLDSVDCYVMGSRTYEHALKLGWPYGDKPVMVLTSRTLQKEKETVFFYSGGLKELVEENFMPNYQNIWVVGGSELIREFLQQGLADTIVITILPIILGGGIPFFNAIGKEIPLNLLNVVAYQDGMVELTYTIPK